MAWKKRPLISSCNTKAQLARTASHSSRVSAAFSARPHGSQYSLKGMGNFIAESPLLYLPMTALW